MNRRGPPRRATQSLLRSALQVETAKILPGEYYATNKDMALVTVLGSCVSGVPARPRDRHRRHEPLHAAGRGQDRRLPRQRERRAGATACTRWSCSSTRSSSSGGRRDRLEAEGVRRRQRAAGLHALQRGQQNAEFIVEYLNIERIPIAARDLLDIWPRKIYYFPRTGRVMVKRLRKINNDTIVLRERDYGARLFHGNLEGGAELFK
jgi:chemotaxis protein CheD